MQNVHQPRFPDACPDPGSVRDLIDFHVRWQEFRVIAEAAAAAAKLSLEEQQVVKWLIVLADRVGPRDLE